MPINGFLRSSKLGSKVLLKKLKKMKLSFHDSRKFLEQRRSVYPKSFELGHVSKEELVKLLEVAQFAPNHKNTQPWHFVVYRGSALADLLEKQTEFIFQQKGENDETKLKAQKMKSKGDKSSAIIAVIMKRDVQQRVPAFEEEWAVACAVQNILLHAASLNIGAYWSTGNTDSLPMREVLNLKENDRHMGWLFVGKYSGEIPFRKERKTVAEFTEWKD